MDTLFNPDKKILWRMANAILLTGICLSCAGRFLRIPTLAPVHVLTSLAVVLVLTFLSSMTARGRLLVLTGTLLLIFGAMSAVGLKNCVSFFLSYFHWLGGAPLPAGQSAAGFELIQAILSALSCYLLQILMEKDFRLKTAELAVLISILLYCLFARKALSRISVALILCQGAFILSEWTQLRWKKEKSGSLSAYMLWLIPFLGIYFLLMLLPAAPDEPYDWQIVKNAYRQIRESFLKFSYNFSGFGGDDYDLTLSGFSARGELSGESVETSREIMTVKSAKRLAANLYLTGKAYDSFDGKEWTAANTAPSNSHYLDTIETLHTLERYDGDYLSDYLYQADITINYRYFRSEFLFAPLKTLSLKQNSSNLAFQESGAGLSFDRRKGYGTEYKASFYQLNAGDALFEEFLDQAEYYPQEEIPEGLFRMLRERTGVSLDMDDLSAYRQTVWDCYTEEVALSPEARAYLTEITAGCRTQAQRLRAIERELSTFTYTRSPGSLPEQIHNAAGFLDYFLLEKKEGYCNHFATAFVLLARAQGLPARFVQGFCVPIKGKTQADVYSGMAHAWPEVYFEGIGWIPFEPTPGYSEIRYASWAPRNRDAGSASGLPAPSPLPEKERDSLRASLLKETEAPPESEGSSGENSFRQILRTLLLALLSILGAGVLLLFLSGLVSRRRYRKMPPSLKFKALVAANLRILSLLGYKRKKTETLAEFKDRVLPSLPEKENLAFLNSYEDFLYGEQEITLLILEDTANARGRLMRLLKQKKRWTYLFFRMITVGR